MDKNTIIEREDTFSGPLFRLVGSHASLSNIFIQGPTSHLLAYGPLVEFSTANFCSMKDCIIDATVVTAVSFADQSKRNTMVNNFITGSAVGIHFSVDSEKNLVTGNQIVSDSAQVHDGPSSQNNFVTTTNVVGTV